MWASKFFIMEVNPVDKREQILKYLSESGAISEEKALSPKVIALEVFGQKKKKLVNPVLYGLLKDNKVGKIADDETGRNPRWYLKVSERPRLRVRARLKSSCVVCYDNRIEVLLQCKHAPCCYNCSRRIRKCPICNERITEKMRIYVP